MEPSIDLERRKCDRRQSDQDLKLKEKILSGILKNSSEGFILIDENMRFMFFNSAAKVLLHPINWGDLTGSDIKAAFPEKTKLYQEIIISVHSKMQTNFKWESFKNNWIEINIIPYGLITLVIARDTKKLEYEDLQRHKLNQNAIEIIESISDGFFSVNDRNEFTYMNSRAEEYLAKKAGLLIGKKLWNELSDFNVILLKEYCNKALNEQKTINFETDNFIKDQWFEIYIYPKPNGLAFCLRDINKRKDLEKEINKLDRLHTIGEVAASIGHEIRNPMTTVRGFLQLLSEKEENQNNQEIYHLMIDEIDRANLIITEFLSLAKNRAVNRRPCNLALQMKNMEPLILASTALTDKNLSLEMEPVPDLMLDNNEIKQLLLNLIRNGLEAMVPGQTLTVKVYQKDNGVMLEVADMGSGIAPDIIDKLGTPFVSTKENGTGLGIPVCYSIVAHHQGKIWFETGDQGTTFFVQFFQ